MICPWVTKKFYRKCSAGTNMTISGVRLDPYPRAILKFQPPSSLDYSPKSGLVDSQSNRTVPPKLGSPNACLLLKSD